MSPASPPDSAPAEEEEAAPPEALRRAPPLACVSQPLTWSTWLGDRASELAFVYWRHRSLLLPTRHPTDYSAPHCCYLCRKLEGAETLVGGGRLWVDVDEHERLAVASQAGLRGTKGREEGKGVE